MTQEEINAVANELEEQCRRNRGISQSTKDYWCVIAKAAIERLDLIRSGTNAKS